MLETAATAGKCICGMVKKTKSGFPCKHEVFKNRPYYGRIHYERKCIPNHLSKLYNITGFLDIKMGAAIKQLFYY